MRAVRRLSQFGWDALTGRLGITMMVFTWAVTAVILLAYVSTQIYTSSLQEDIAQRKGMERRLTERIGLLTADYAQLASRSRIARYCEQELGMVQADRTSMMRVWVDSDEDVWRAPDDGNAVRLPAVLGSDIEEITEAMR